METYDPNGLVEEKDFILNPLKYRPLRPHSIEFEFNGNQDTLMDMFKGAGLDIPYTHSSNPDDDPWASMGDDCTVSGGELRFSRLNFSSRKDMKKMHKAFSVIDQAIQRDHIDLESNCGFHNHIDMHGVSEKEALALINVWNYLEDPIFQLASALTPGPRGECGPTPKAGFTCRSVTRGHGLSLSGYSARALRCVACSAGNPCAENHGQCTAEFRVFNGTGNMKKTLAYVALCQGLLSFAKLQARTDNIEVGEHFDAHNSYENGRTYWDDYDERYRCNDCDEWQEYCECGEKLISNTDISWANTTMDRLTWLFHNLPLSKFDKSNLGYCAKNSNLYKSSLPESFLNNLEKTPSKQHKTDRVIADKRGFRRVPRRIARQWPPNEDGLLNLDF